jgi:DNA-binding CsgD family transcriptional regulator
MRETEVCFLLVEGLSLEETATRLSISTHTADCHRANIYRKLRIRRRDELLALFVGPVAAGTNPATHPLLVR